MIKGLNHITLSVMNLADSFSFYKDILGFKPLMKRKKSAYFLAGGSWFCIEEDVHTRSHELPEYTHIAFSVSQDDFDLMAEKLHQFKVKKFKENISEGDSLYFIDPNGHKLELHVGDWQSRLKSYKDDEECEFFLSRNEMENL